MIGYFHWMHDQLRWTESNIQQLFWGIKFLIRDIIQILVFFPSENVVIT